MASIRRTLSPVPRPGALMNGEACQAASPLSKSSSNTQNYPQPGTLDHTMYRAHNFILNLFSQRSSRPFDRSKLKGGQIWRRAFLHFLMCFVVGIFVGLTPFVPNHFEFLQKSETFSLNENSTSELSNELVRDVTLNDPLDLVFRKLLIIVTPIPVQTYYLNRLAQTLKLVPHPLLWILVEMNSQSVETAELLRNTGIMYRHLVSTFQNSTELTQKSALLRNVALSHIEMHRLDGIVYFADDDKIYSTDLFDQIRRISGVGIWTSAKLVENEGVVYVEGPVCNNTQVIGWHAVDTAKRYRRFHVEMSGFAFNSTIVWDTKRWHRPTIEPIRQLQTVKEDLLASTFIEQIVEDESQMECLTMEDSRIMVWDNSIDLR